MTDDIMTRVREWLASCVRVATENGVPEEADLEAAALAFIDGEPARLADELRRARRARGGQVKTPKRVKGYVVANVDNSPCTFVLPRHRIKRLRNQPGDRVARVVELRRGEFIVSEEALQTFVALRGGQLFADEVPAALRKVGKR